MRRRPPSSALSTATVWTAGDNVYPSGSVTANWDCYEASWGGAIKARTRPVPGNHDWGTGQGGAVNLDAYNTYFGASATDAGLKSYYSYDIAGSNWHVVNLDTECAEVIGGCTAGSAQELWLKADLAANSTKNVIAVWHKPRYSSGATNLDDLQPFWDDMYAAGVDLVLQGHDHIYERFAPIKSGATLASQPVADPVYGIPVITVGTGGAGLQSCPGTTFTASAVCNSSTYGVMKLTLHATTYDWKFLPIAGSTFTDSGTGSVHAAPVTGNTAPDAPTLNSPGNAATGVGTSPTLDIDVSDPDADPLTVTYYGRPFASGNYAQIGAPHTGVASGTNDTISWPNLGAGQTFQWYATVNDGTDTTYRPHLDLPHRRERRPRLRRRRRHRLVRRHHGHGHRQRHRGH